MATPLAPINKAPAAQQAQIPGARAAIPGQAGSAENVLQRQIQALQEQVNAASQKGGNKGRKGTSNSGGRKRETEWINASRWGGMADYLLHRILSFVGVTRLKKQRFNSQQFSKSRNILAKAIWGSFNFSFLSISSSQGGFCQPCLPDQPSERQ